MYAINVIDDVKHGLSDVYLMQDEKVIECRLDLDNDMTEHYIATLYYNYELDEDTTIEDDGGNTTIREFLEL